MSTRSDSAPPVGGRSRQAASRAFGALQRDGSLGLVRMVRHGLSWRSRRVINGLTASHPLVATAMARRRARDVSRTVDVAFSSIEVTASQSLATAEAVLASLSVPALQSRNDPKQPTVGIVIPTFRDSAFLGAALQSVVDQTYGRWTCVVVDDASPEDVASIVKPFRLADRRVTLLRHASNGGLPAARNTGLRGVDADIVMFLDADDMLVPEALTHIVEAFTPVWSDDGVAGVHGQVIQVPEETELADLAAWSGTFVRDVVDWSHYTGECPFNVHAVAVRKSLLDLCGGFDEALVNGAEDWDLWFRLLRHGYRFEPHSNLIGAYRQRRASMIRDHRAVHIARADRLFEAMEEFARLDPALIVGRGAAAPLSHARTALARALRTASIMGMQVSSTASLDPLMESEALSLLDLASLAEGLRDDIATAAGNGALRGLGLSRATERSLSFAARRKLEVISKLVADSILCTPPPEIEAPRSYDATSRRQPFDVLLLAESAADVRALEPVVTADAHNGSLAAADLELLTGHSSANKCWRELGVAVIPYHHVVSSMPSVSHLVAVAPVGPVTADLLVAAQKAGVTCHIFRPAGRPETLHVSAAWALEPRVVPLGSVLEALRVPIDHTHRRSPPHLAGWRGSTFPARLPFEDGPIDVDSVSKLRNLHNSRVGETAVIIGNGPSLNDTELEILTEVPTFGVNAIFLAADRLPKPITYYVVEDTSVFKENLHDIKAVAAEWKLFPAMYRPFFSEEDLDGHVLFFRMNAGFYERKTGTTGHPRFSTDATQRLFCGQSVTIINLQLAHWMGFERVVLVGMDFNYTIPEDVDRDGALIISRSDDPNHFDPRYFGAGKSWKDPMLDRVLVNYHLASEMYRATGREIINATEGGKLDLFPRLSLREAIAFDG